MEQPNPYPLFPWRGASTPTAGDLVTLFGEVTARRILVRPSPGTATVSDVIAIHDREDRKCELIDGVLVEKPAGISYRLFATELLQIFYQFTKQNTAGSAGLSSSMMCLGPGVVRVPDLSFFSINPHPPSTSGPAPLLYASPDLAVEILGPEKGRAEMKRKLRDYFEHGTKLVWCLEPSERTVRVHTSPDQFRTMDESGTLDGSVILPSFEVSIAEWFGRVDAYCGGAYSRPNSVVDWKPMSEADWLASDDPWMMIENIERAQFEVVEEVDLEVSVRKMLLCGVACCRRAEFVTTDPTHYAAIDAAELLADGLIGSEQFDKIKEPIAARWPSFSAWGVAPNREDPMNLHDYMNAAIFHIESRGGIKYAANFASRALARQQGEDVRCYQTNENGPIVTDEGPVLSEPGPILRSEKAIQSDLIRDIIGNPFRPVIFDPSWLDSTVIELARSIYDARDFDRMPMLGDALEKAGCNNRTILDHCRGQVKHVRGCWVVDHLLGKS